MEQMIFGVTPFEDTRRTQLTHVPAQHNKCMRIMIVTKGEIGKVWRLLPTELKSFGFNKMELKPQHRHDIGAVYWVPEGVYMIEHWDGKRDHRSYVKVNETGDMAANYSLTLEMDYRTHGWTLRVPTRATLWLRDQFPKPRFVDGKR